MQRAGNRQDWFDQSALSNVTIPVMVLAGEADDIIGPPELLAAAIPGVTLVKTPGDHITALVKPQFRQAILNFLAQHSPAAAYGALPWSSTPTPPESRKSVS